MMQKKEKLEKIREELEFFGLGHLAEAELEWQEGKRKNPPYVVEFIPPRKSYLDQLIEELGDE